MARTKVGRVFLGQVERPAVRGSDIVDGQEAIVSKLCCVFVFPILSHHIHE